MRLLIIFLNVINIFASSNGISSISIDGNDQSYENFKTLVNTIGTLEEGNFTNYHLTQLPSKFMGSQPTLKILTITLSKIIEIKNNSFEGLENLEMLNLSQNNIEILDDSYFSQLERLKGLDLSFNSIAIVVAESFEGLKKMVNLNLENNAIEEIPVGIFQYSLELKYINLSSNKIKQISSQLFHNLKKLKTLDLSNNRIEILAEDFITNSSIAVLYLNNNLLTGVDVSNFDTKLKNLKKIRIQNNPWLCSCFNDLMKWLKSNNVKYFVKEYFEGNRPICVFEAELIKELPDEDSKDNSQCRRLRNAEHKIVQNAYKEAINKYSPNKTNSDSINS